MPDLLEVLTARPIRPAALVTVTIGGKTFQCTRRTAAHLLATQDRLKAAHPTAWLRIIQGCYNTGVAASAGTHDYDAVVDVEIVGLGWTEAQDFLRDCGWAAWVRQPPTFSWHIHMVSLGYPARVGVYVPGQVADYLAHRTGLAGHAPDTSWHPTDISSTIFDYPAWVADQEDNMPISDSDLAKVQAAAKAGTLEALNEATIDVGGGKKWSPITVLRSTYNKVKALG